MTSDYISILAVMELTDESQKTVYRRIAAGEYETLTVPSTKQKGKFQTKIAVNSLPAPAQKKYWDAIGAANPDRHHPEPVDDRESKIERLSLLEANQWLDRLPAIHRERVEHRYQVVAGWDDRPANQPLIEYLKPHNVSQSTFYAWRLGYKTQGIIGLADWRFGHSRAKLRAAHKKYVEQLIRQNPDRRPARIFDYLHREFPELGASYMCVNRFLKKWKTQNAELYTYLLSPDQWKSEFQCAFGSQSEKAKRFLHYIELDSTPADVICSDGVRYNITGAIDIFSRKPKVVVSPASNSQGIAALMRSIITGWGVPEYIVRDNGKDFTSNHVERILLDLEIKTVTAQPFTPEAKPHIERFFRTLSGSLLEELQGYCGHNVAQRKRIESRRSFASRLMRQGEDPIQMSISAERLQEIIDAWIENVYLHRVHAGIKTTPELKAAQTPEPVRHIGDERALDVLLLKCGERTVQKSGIAYEGGRYVHPALAGRIKQTVEVRRDADRADLLYVFAPGAEGYICTAQDRALANYTSADYQSARKLQRKRLVEKQRAVETLTTDPMLDLVDAAGESKKIVGMKRRKKLNSKNIDRAADAALQRNGIKPDRYKSIAEHMAEEGYPEPSSADDWFDDVDWVAEQQLFNSWPEILNG